MPEQDQYPTRPTESNEHVTPPYSPEDDIESTAEELRCHLTIGATPLAGIEYPDVLKMQNEVVQPMLIDRIERNSPVDTPEAIRNFMLHSFLTRFAGRAAKNYDSYVERLVKTQPQEISPEFVLLHDKAMRGTASPDELIIVQRVLRMRAIELGRLTHPYGAQIHLLQPMRDIVAQSIQDQGGAVLSPKDYNEKYKIRSTDLLINAGNADEVVAILMTRRRNIGFLDDDTLVMERSSFVVPIYEGSRYDPVLSQNMRCVTMLDNPNRLAELEAAGRLSEIAPQLLASNDFASAIPQSTTIFAYNATNNAAILAEKQRTTSHTELDRIRELTIKYVPDYINTIDKMKQALDAETNDQ